MGPSVMCFIMAKKIKRRPGGSPNPYKEKKVRQQLRCPVCGASLKMIPVSEMGFRFTAPKSRRHDFYWVCSKFPECNTYAPADNATKKPWGKLAGPALRHKRMCIHHWEEHLVTGGFYTRAGFRDMCSYLAGTPSAVQTHVRDMTEMQCDAILNHMKKLYENNARIHEYVESKPNSTMWKDVRGLNTGANHGLFYNDDGEVTGMKEDTAAKEALRAENKRVKLERF